MIKNHFFSSAGIRYPDIRFFKHLKHVISLAALSILIASPVSAQNLARGYASTDTELKPGMAVVIAADSKPDKPLVERAGPDDADKVIGVTTKADSNLVTIASGQQTAYVQTSGVVAAYVSDVNGNVKKGDKLTVAPLKGILARAGDNSTVIGRALEDLPSSGAETQTINNGRGSSMVKIAKMNLVLESGLASGGQNNVKLSPLERLGRAVIGRDVGEIQVIVALAIFLIVIVAEGGIMYGAISSAITSVGRNPLARSIISREMIKVLAVALVVLLIGLGAIYSILSL